MTVAADGPATVMVLPLGQGDPPLAQWLERLHALY